MLKTIRRYLLHASVPIQKLMQKIHRPDFKIDDEFYNTVKQRIQNGDILLSREDWHFTNSFIPGYWKHCAIYSDKYVIEAVGEGVRQQLLEHWVFSKDYVAVLRPMFCDRTIRFFAGHEAEKWIGKKYDFEFSAGMKSLYCSELVFHAYRIATLGKMPFVPRETFGMQTVTPTDFWRARTKFDVIAISPNAQSIK